MLRKEDWMHKESTERAKEDVVMHSMMLPPGYAQSSIDLT